MLLLAGTQSFAHRLDEYLQGTILSIEESRVSAQMTLTPGIAVYRFLFSSIDADGDGVISQAEQHAYGMRMLSDLSLSIDDQRLMPQLLAVRFPAMEEMKEGRGEIQIEFDAKLPSGGRSRKLKLENHHQSRISAYLVNCLVSKDRAIRITGQQRNYEQSQYELDFVQTGVESGWMTASWWLGGARWLGVAAIFLIARLGWLMPALGPWRRSNPQLNQPSAGEQ